MKKKQLDKQFDCEGDEDTMDIHNTHDNAKHDAEHEEDDIDYDTEDNMEDDMEHDTEDNTEDDMEHDAAPQKAL